MDGQGTLTIPVTYLPFTAAVLTLICALVLIPIARRSGWLDQPSARKDHAAPTPLVGGPAIFVGLFGALALAGGVDWPLLTACLLVLLTGMVDDRWGLAAASRFILQGLACLVMIFSADVMLLDFGRLFWDGVLELGPLAWPITVFSALGVINAFNMIDGVDGVSGSLFVIGCLAMAVLALFGGRPDAVTPLTVAGGAVMGFLALNARLPWNPSARLFLGDSGSLLLGLFLAWWFIDLGNGTRDDLGRAFAPMTAVWIFGLPLLDTTRLMRNRWRAGRSAFEADRFHLHHAFLRAGFTVGQTWWGIVALAVAFAATGVAFEWLGLPEYMSFYAFIATGLVYFGLMKKAWSRGRFLGRPIAD